MLEGIEVLNKTEIMCPPTWALLLLFITMIVAVIFVFAALIGEKYDLYVAFISLLLLLLIVGSCILCCVLEKPTGKYEYKVTIDDSVSMNEFNERYEIIEVEGRIYTIKEKE